MVDRTTNSYAHHRPIPPWTARTGRRDIARGRTYSRLGSGGNRPPRRQARSVTSTPAGRPGGAIIAARCPERTTQPPLSACGWNRAKWAENQVRLMYGILKKGRRVCSSTILWASPSCPCIGRTEKVPRIRGTFCSGRRPAARAECCTQSAPDRRLGKFRCPLARVVLAGGAARSTLK
jgi:hypothetical protein